MLVCQTVDYKIIVNRDFYLVAVLLFLQIKLNTFLCKSLQSISKYPQFQYLFFSIEVLVKTSYSCFLYHSFRERGKEIRNETKTHNSEHTNTLSILLLCWNRKQNLVILAPTKVFVHVVVSLTREWAQCCPQQSFHTLNKRTHCFSCGNRAPSYDIPASI